MVLFCMQSREQQSICRFPLNLCGLSCWINELKQFAWIERIDLRLRIHGRHETKANLGSLLMATGNSTLALSANIHNRELFWAQKHLSCMLNHWKMNIFLRIHHFIYTNLCDRKSTDCLQRTCKSISRWHY